MKEIHPIENYDKYLNGLNSTMDDKLFFTKFVNENEIKTIIDFGCGDGELLKRVRSYYPNVFLIGIDDNSTMREKAQDKMDNDANCCIVDSFEHALRELYERGLDTKDTLVNCSSVIHEVYSYWKPTKVLLDFWLPLLDSQFKYVSIRDMCLNECDDTPANINDIFSVCKKLPNNMIEDFENCHGSICNRKNLIHLLMKYRYTDNWERECTENYFPITVEELFRNFYGWNIVYSKRFTVPFTKKKIQEDFGILLNTNTHIKILFKN